MERGDLPKAATLLAARHRRQAGQEPLLGEEYADPGVALQHLEEVWANEPIASSVAERDGRLVGYLLAGSKPSRPWGENAWVESAGQALAADVSPEVMRDLYAAAAATWMAQGLRAHYVLVPTTEVGLVDAWWRLGFGLQHVHAIREPLPQADGRSVGERNAGLTLRTPVRADLPALAELGLELPRHQAAAPVFSSAPVPSYEESLAEWAEDFDGETHRPHQCTTFVAARDDDIVGCAVACPLEVSSMYAGPLRTPNAGFLGFAAVRPAARRQGAGRRLAESVLRWSIEQGYGSVVTDWRSTNLQSSRAWPALGFRPTFWRLHRLVGH